MSKRTRPYEDSLLDDLKDAEEAAAYLNAHLCDRSDEAEALFLLALRDVARAHGFSTVAEEANLGRESLYKTLSANGNPKLTTLNSVLKAMGLRVTVEVDAA